MDVQILVETIVDDGSTPRREIASLDRTPDSLAPETLGLRLDEAKNLLTRLQEVLLCNQIDEVLAASRICDDCGKRRAIHADRGRSLDTLYSRFWVNAPRLRQCACKLGTGAAKVVLLSPLNMMFPDGATPEFQRLQAEFVSRCSPVARNVPAVCAPV